MQINKLKTPNCDFAYISMQLDNVGCKDLDIWKHLQKEILNRTDYQDVITFCKVTNNNVNKTKIYIENYPLELQDINIVPVYEPAYLKAYTLLARLSKEIIETKNLSKTPDIMHTISKTQSNLSSFLRNNLSGYVATQSGIQGPIREIASNINTSIQKIMNDYFGI